MNYYFSAVPPPKAQGGQPCPCVGDPVNPANGNVFAQEPDIPAHASSIPFMRFYNSANSNSGDLGVGWRHSFSRRIEVTYQPLLYQPHVAGGSGSSSLYADAASACTNGFAEVKSQVENWRLATASYSGGACTLSAGSSTIGAAPVMTNSLQDPASGSAVVGIDVVRDDGRRISFSMQGGAIVAPPAVTLRLEQTTGGFTVIDENDAVESYDASGKLLAITTRGGVIQSLTYDGANRLSNVSDPFGHSLTLSYTIQDRLLSVTDPSGNTIQYVYDTKRRLSRVVGTDATSRSYLYENESFRNALTGIVDEIGVRSSSWSYDAQGRAIVTEEANGAGAVSITYNSANGAGP